MEHGRIEDAEKAKTMAEPLLQFFVYSHLPNELQTISKEFYALALFIVETLPRNPERTVALRKLLEAKDCAIRAKLYR
jgi:ferritin-like protein